MQLRAPTSDVNITLGLALVSFIYFEFQGFKRLGVGGYLGKFFPLYEFKNGIAAGGIALFVGLVELMLEFVKPVTLSMRLFGNIYGGEVALGVITALTIAFVPVGLLGLEVLLNAIQALIFSILTLMFIVLAIESHGHEEGHVAEEALDAPHGSEPDAPARPLTRRPRRSPPTVSMIPCRRPGEQEEDTTWITQAPDSQPLALSVRASASASWAAWPPRRSGATPTRPARSAASRSSSRRSPRASASSRSSSVCSRSSSSRP